MAILNYTTKINHHQTIGEISKILVDNGCKKITVDYGEAGVPEALTFTLDKYNKMSFYSLPARWEGVLKAMTKQKVQKNLLTKEQAIRISWRNILTWVAAQMAMIEAEQCEIEEIFLPYLITKSGNTLFEDLKNNNFKLLQ